MAVRVPVASSAASEVTWRSVRSDIEARVLSGPPENIATDIRLVGPGRSQSGPCNRSLRTSTCIVTRQPSAQITLRPTSAALPDIRFQRTMPSVCGGALPASSALRTEPASVPVSFRSPGCPPTTEPRVSVPDSAQTCRGFLLGTTGKGSVIERAVAAMR